MIATGITFSPFAAKLTSGANKKSPEAFATELSDAIETQL